MNPITIRLAGPADQDTLRRLAALDSARVPRGRVLIAEFRGRPVAALPLDSDAAAIADPFERTTAIVEMLEQARGVPGLRREQRVRDLAVDRLGRPALVHS